MKLMTWTEAMSVGVPELDADHRVLIKVINELALNSANQDRDSVLRQCLYALLRYAEFHFGREEKVMEACGFPGIDHHKDEHVAFTDHIQSLARKIDEGEVAAGDVVDQDLLDYLKNWLFHHILIEDKAYSDLAIASKEARTAAKAFRASEIWWS
jgi:hemerythrin-like metal-binding protein